MSGQHPKSTAFQYNQFKVAMYGIRYMYMIIKYMVKSLQHVIYFCSDIYVDSQVILLVIHNFNVQVVKYSLKILG